jgi:hypothetical protein
MHERTRRHLCRLLFIALCAVPTLITSTWATYRVSPFHAAAQRAAWESLLLERTGFVATIDHIEQPAGGSVVLAGVELLDPDGGERVMRLRQIEIATAPQGKVLLLSQPQIAQGQFLRLWDMLHDRVIRGRPPNSAIQISTGELTVEIGQRAQTFTHLRCTVEPLETGVRALVDFQLAGFEMPSPAQLRIDRNRQVTPPTTSWLFHTDTFVPCDLFGDYLPAVAFLGPECQFQGTVAAVMTRDDWSGELSGQFSHVDLDRATSSFPHKVTGSADLGVHRALFQRGMLRQATGQLLANGGVISTSLLRSLSEQLGADTSTSASRISRPYAEYRQIAFDFELSPQGMTIVGRCPGTKAGVVMCSASEDLLSLNPAQQLTWIGLVRALSPASDLLVPATQQSKGLLGVLALPDAQPAPTAIARPPQARVQLK